MSASILPDPSRMPDGVPWTPLFDTLPVGLAAAAVEGHWLRVNEALARMFGCEPHHIAGRHFAEFTHPDDVALHDAALPDLDAGRLASLELEKRYVRPDGSVFWSLTTVTLVRGADGVPVGRLVTVRDITAQREAEDTLLASASNHRAAADWNAALLDDMRECLARVAARDTLVGVCSWCRCLQVGPGAWMPVEQYLREYHDTDVTHGICPGCAARVESHDGDGRPGGPPGRT